jgi:hypothetical protein
LEEIMVTQPKSQLGSGPKDTLSAVQQCSLDNREMIAKVKGKDRELNRKMKTKVAV